MNSLGNKVFDLSGNGKTGTLQGNTHWVLGKFGPALHCSEAGTSISVPHFPFYEGIPAFSISLWAKSNTISLGEFLISNAGGGDDTFEFYIHGGNDNLTFQVWNTLNETASGFATDAILGSDLDWHHFVGVFDSPDVMVYLDSVIGNIIGNLSGNSQVTDNVLRIGYSSTNPVIISHVMIYNRALAASEIALLYREPFCMFPENIMPEFGIVA